MSYSVLTLPTHRLFTPQRADFGLRPNIRISTSPFTDSIRTTEIPGARWVCSLSFTPHDVGARAELEGFFAQLRGQANRLEMGHPLRRLPRGTIRGTTTTFGAAVRGANQVTVAGMAVGATILRGDLLGIGDQLVMCTVDTTANASGQALMDFAPQLRKDVPGATQVEWNWPKTRFMLSENEVRVPLAPIITPAFTVDFIEMWEV